MNTVTMFDILVNKPRTFLMAQQSYASGSDVSLQVVTWHSMKAWIMRMKGIKGRACTISSSLQHRRGSLQHAEGMFTEPCILYLALLLGPP